MHFLLLSSAHTPQNFDTIVSLKKLRCMVLFSRVMITVYYSNYQDLEPTMIYVIIINFIFILRFFYSKITYLPITLITYTLSLDNDFFYWKVSKLANKLLNEMGSLVAYIMSVLVD